jgi:hypothetical protein
VTANGLAFQQGLFQEFAAGYSVSRIKSDDAYALILDVHYAHRIPSISHAFGLFSGGSLVGVVTYGTSPSSTLARGLCGDEWASRVLELNRLVLLNNEQHEASRLVGASLQMLPKPTIVVSFADTKQGHEGVVYQATNFIYTGLSAKFLDPKVRGLEHQHHATYAHGLTNAQVIEKYGTENVYFEERSRKHRYVFFVGTKYDKKRMRLALKYSVLPYPKKEGK